MDRALVVLAVLEILQATAEFPNSPRLSFRRHIDATPEINAVTDGLAIALVAAT
jgi:hypothetical protein